MDHNQNKETVDFAKKLGIDSLPVEKQEEIVKRMADVLDKRIILRVMDELSEDEVMEINATFVSENREEALKILEKKIPNFDKIFLEEVNKLKEEMLK